MEDPITFDVWCRVSRENEAEAKELLQSANPSMTRIAVLQMLTKARLSGHMINCVQDVGWSAAQNWRRELEAAFGEVEVFQSGWDSSDEKKLFSCGAHAIRYGGCLGCPVCRGWNAP